MIEACRAHAAHSDVMDAMRASAVTLVFAFSKYRGKDLVLALALAHLADLNGDDIPADLSILSDMTRETEWTVLGRLLQFMADGWLVDFVDEVADRVVGYRISQFWMEVHASQLESDISPVNTSSVPNA